jgi:hypothetical protein
MGHEGIMATATVTYQAVPQSLLKRGLMEVQMVEQHEF